MTRYLLASLALAFGVPALAAAARRSPPSPRIPPRSSSRASDDAPQLVITGKRADGREIDLSARRDLLACPNPKVIRVEPNGRVFPLANGSAEITATFEGKTVEGAGDGREDGGAAADQLRQPRRADLHQARVQLAAAATGRSPGRTASACRCSASTRSSTTTTC